MITTSTLTALRQSLIVDVHTHIFPPEIADERDAYLASDATFAELYASPKARLATAAELLESMDAAGIDVSAALGFACAFLASARSILSGKRCTKAAHSSKRL